MAWCRPPTSRLTYGVLNRRASQLARTPGISASGRDAGRDSPGTLVRHDRRHARRAEGGGRTFLDPHLPLKRLSFLLEDCGPSVVLSREALADALPATWASLVCLDSDATAVRARAGRIRRDRPRPGWPILYTSGSTGQPSRPSCIGVVASCGTRATPASAPTTFSCRPRRRRSTRRLSNLGALLNGSRLVLLSQTPSLDDLLTRSGATVTTLW